MNRTVTRLRDGWKFTRTDSSAHQNPDLDDSAWTSVRVPHDWAIAGPFDREHDRVTQVKKQADVEAGVREITGRTGGLPHVGVGWYRRTLNIPAEAAGKQIRLEVDGAMSNCTVYCNGTLVGGWPCGYTSFALDLTPFLRPGRENVLAVRLENLPESSRWYPGAGLYRNVRLLVLHPVHVAHWGTWLTTPALTEKEGTVSLETTIRNAGPGTAVTLRTAILDSTGAAVCVEEVTRSISASETLRQEFRVPDPQAWHPETPNLYTALSTVLVEGETVDTYETPFGFRTLAFDPDKGFRINGRSLKLKGVCMHHDLGPLGAAVNLAALRRQLRMLQDMGCNAIRTSHNPPAPELLELCDRMGLLVIDEAFDEWAAPKLKNGYSRLFADWAEKDLRAMIRRDRNHPCVILWSIGNEIPEQNSPQGAEVAQALCAICKDEDPTRLTTAGFNQADGAIRNGLADAVDVPGWNYKPDRYVDFHARLPGKPTYGSETESTYSSRGEYFFPVNEEIGPFRVPHHVSSYDLEFPNWGYSPDVEFRAQDECPFSLGAFVWTGFDYLGEPTPFSEAWPSRSSYFGIIDLAGLPKDRYYLYQSTWSPTPVLHLLPHWTWPGREGETTPVYCYTNFASAELFVNGVSQGRRRKSVKLVTGAYRLIWPGVRYQPGELKAVAYDRDGSVAAETVIRTAGGAAAVELLPARREMEADGDEMMFITARIVDMDGNLCPRADHRLTFQIEGPGTLEGLCNGDPTSLESFKGSRMRAFNGKCVLYLGSVAGRPGDIRVTVSADGLRCGQLSLESRQTVARS